MSHPWVVIEPKVSQREFFKFQIFSNSAGFSSHGCGFSQSSFDNLELIGRKVIALHSRKSYNNLHLAINTRIKDINKNKAPVYIHTTVDNGPMKP